MSEYSDGSIIIDTELNTKGFKADSAELKKAVKSLSTKLESLGTALQKVFSGNASGISSFTTKAALLEDQISSIQSRMEALKESRLPTQEYQEFTDRADQAGRELEKLYEKQKKLEALKVNKNSTQWKSLQYEIKQAGEKVERYNALVEQMEINGTAFQLGADTEEYKQLETQLSLIKQKYADMQVQAESATNVGELNKDIERASVEIDRLIKKYESLKAQNAGIDSPQWRTLQGDIANAADKVSEYRARVSELQAGSIDTSGVQANLEGLESKISALQSANGKTEALRTSFVNLGNTIAGVGKKAVSALGTLIKYLGGGRAAIARFNRGGMDTNKTIGKLRKSITGFMGLLKRLALRKLIMSIFSALKDGVQNLAKYSSTFNSDMSELLTLFSQLKNTLATLFAPILSIAMPALTVLIEAFQSAAEKAAEFFAALSGSSTFTKALKKYKDYAASLQKSVTASFDQLNLLSDDDEEDVSTLFETADVSSSVTAFIAQLKEAFANGDLSFMGELLAEKFNGFLANINGFLSDTSKLQTGIQAVVSAINSFINGVDWELAGDVIGNAIMAIVDSLHILYTSFDWSGLGAALANTLNGIIETVDWKAAGSLIVERFNAILAFLHTAVKTFDWAALGSALADGVNGVFATIDWNEIWMFISDTFIGIGNGLIALIKDIDWDLVGKSINDCLLGFVDACIALVQDIDWVELFKGLGDALMSLFTNIDWAELTSSLSELAGSLVALLLQLLWNGLKNSLNSTLDMFKSIGDYFSSAIEECGGNIALGILKGIGDFFVNIGTWIYEHIFKPFVDGFKKLFGINSPSTVMAEFGGYIVEGLLNGIKNLWSTITNFFSSAFEGIKNLISNAWSAIKSGATAAWEGIKSTLSTVWEGVKSVASTVWNGLTSTVSNAWNSIKSTTSTIWNNISSAVSNVWNNVKSTASSVWSGITSTVSNAWNNIKSTTSTVWNSVSSTVSNVWDKMKSSASTVWNNLKSTISNAWSNVKTTTSSVWSNISSTLSSTWSNVKSAASTAWNNVTSTISNAWSSLKSNASTWGKDLVSNMASGISNAVDTVKNAVSSIASKIKSWLGFSEPEEGPLSNFHTFMPDMLDLMAEGIEDNENVPLNAVADIAQAIRDEFDNDEYALGTVGVTSALDNSLNIFADKVKSHFDSLIERLQSIANGVTFAVPAAAGAIVPHGTGGTGNETGEKYNRLIALMETIINKLGGVTEGLDEAQKAIVEAIDEKETGISGESIYNVVKSSAKKETKATGRNPFGG